MEISSETTLLNVIDQLNSKLADDPDTVTEIQISVHPNYERFTAQMKFFNSPISSDVPEKQFSEKLMGTKDGLLVLEILEFYEVGFNRVVDAEGAVVLINSSTIY